MGWLSGRLASRPGVAGTDDRAQPVDRPTGIGPAFIVPSAPASGPRPLIVLLHGAGGTSRDILPVLSGAAERHGFLVWAPKSRRATWDVIADRFGPDVEGIDVALGRIFETFSVDPARVAIAGFSDGASYALTLGLANGDLFSAVLAFSPGFIAPLAQQGRPRIYISHGDRDTVLPVERCGRRIAERLREARYTVRYEEFSGGHVVPAERVQSALGFSGFDQPQDATPESR